MATKQVNGSDITSTSTKNNRGIAINAGSSTAKVGKLILGASQVNTGSIVVDRETADKAISAGVFAYGTQRPISTRLSVVIGSGSSNVLLSGAGVPSQIRSVHKIESRRTVRKATAMRAGYFNLLTGKFTTNPTTATDSLLAGAASGVDNAASPTRAVPGRLFYKLGSRTPVSVNYKAKTGGWF